ncbi:MAG: hypothetical protein P8X97_02685, partial [Candidatus Bathyarchaeota archaeon]
EGRLFDRKRIMGFGHRIYVTNDPSVWYEVIGPLHNPYFWCLSFLFLGLAIIVQFSTKKKE